MARKVGIVASRPIHFKVGAEVIMKCLGTDYSHVTWVFFGRDNATKFYYEATMSGGVTFTGANVWEARNKYVYYYELEIDQELYDLMLELAMGLCGIKYALLQNVGLKVSEWLHLPTNYFPNGDNLMNCSELVYKFAMLCKIAKEENPDMVSPRDLVDYLRGLNGTV